MCVERRQCTCARASICSWIGWCCAFACCLPCNCFGCGGCCCCCGFRFRFAFECLVRNYCDRHSVQNLFVFAYVTQVDIASLVQNRTQQASCERTQTKLAVLAIRCSSKTWMWQQQQNHSADRDFMCLKHEKKKIKTQFIEMIHNLFVRIAKQCTTKANQSDKSIGLEFVRFLSGIHHAAMSCTLNTCTFEMHHTGPYPIIKSYIIVYLAFY